MTYQLNYHFSWKLASVEMNSSLFSRQFGIPRFHRVELASRSECKYWITRENTFQCIGLGEVNEQYPITQLRMPVESYKLSSPCNM